MSDKPLRIMYVEGHENLSEVIGLALSKLGGFSTVGYSDADEALDGAMETKPHAILVDAAHVNGLASYFLKELRAQVGCHDIPVVLASDRKGVHQIRRYKALGATVVIPTPINPFSLAATMQEVCANAACQETSPDADTVADQVRTSG